MKRKTGIYALICSFALLFLSACGAKLHTEVVFDTPTSGKRIINITIPKLNADEAGKVHGGMEAVDASLKKHLPSELTFSGLTQSGEDTVGTFTLEFDSLEDYNKKLAALVKGNGGNDTVVSITDSGLVKGVQVQDHFLAEYVLSWAEDALVEDGVISKSDKSYIIDSSGHSAKVTYNGTTYESSRNNMVEVTSVEDYGTKNLRVELSETDSGADVKVDFGYSNGEKFSAEILQQWLDSAAPEDAKISELGAENGSSVSYSVDSVEAAEKSLQKLLGDETFAVKESEPIMNTEQSRVERTIDLTFNCGSVCSPTGKKKFVFIPADGWHSNLLGAFSNQDGKEGVEVSTSAPLSFYHEIAFTDMSVESNLGENGGTVILTTSLDQDIAEVAGESVESLLNPANIGDLESEDKSGKKIYTLTLEGKSQEELNTILDTVSPGTSYEIKALPNSGFFTDKVSFTYTNTFGSHFKADSEVKDELKINGYTIDEKKFDHYRYDYHYEGTASKISLRAWILIGSLAAIALAAGGAAFFWHKRKAKNAAEKANTEEPQLESSDLANSKLTETTVIADSLSDAANSTQAVSANLEESPHNPEQAVKDEACAAEQWNESMLI